MNPDRDAALSAHRLDIVVPGGHGRGFTADRGQFVAVVDLHGRQAGDFVAVARHDEGEWLSPAHTRRALRSLFFRVGDCLRSNRGRPMFRRGPGRCRTARHDSNVPPPCDPTRYAVRFRDRRSPQLPREPARGSVGRGDRPRPPPRAGTLQLLPERPRRAPTGRIAARRPGQPARRRRGAGSADGRRPRALSPCPQDIIPGNGPRGDRHARGRLGRRAGDLNATPAQASRPRAAAGRGARKRSRTARPV